MRKSLSILLTAVLLFAGMIFPGTAAAEENYTVLFTADEVTDTDGLIALYHAQEQVKQYDALMKNQSVIEESSEEDSILVGQILEAREYDNGRKEYTAAMSELSLTEEEAEAARSSPYTGNFGKNGSYSSVIVTLKVYLTFYYGTGSNTGMQVQLDKISATLKNKGTFDTVNVDFGFTIFKDYGATLDVRDDKQVSNIGLNVESFLENTEYEEFIHAADQWSDQMPDQLSAECDIYVNRSFSSTPQAKIEIDFLEIRDFCYDFFLY